ncbi:Cullin-domain-containing protein [Metschnikowia bicuspidata]|uniref:Cullin-domain-containing protein n=1 Tax=Metschnikowia bicuspidata TaxID=27322 RepID=A0A4P9ZGB7_9ASCO|nr:Cullin-domain-containing protein [Metschnikowia bicuspidata]
MYTASRRTKIRPPRKSSGPASCTTESFNYEASWRDLADAIEQIQQKNVSTLLYEQLYRKAYAVVLGKCGAKLYSNVSELITKHLLSRRLAVLEVLETSFTNTNEEFLKVVVQEWSEHLQMMKFISDVLMYLNRAYVKENKKLLTYDLGIVLFDVSFLRYNNMEVGTRIVQAVVDEITKSRNGVVITTRLYLAQTISMMQTLLEERTGTALSLPASQGQSYFYREEFETVFLKKSEEYFLALADEYMASANGTSYLRAIHAYIRDEELRLRSLLPRQENKETASHSDTFFLIKSLMENSLVKNRIGRVITYPKENQGLLYWLEPILLASSSFILTGMSPGSAPDYTSELHILYELVGRIDPEHYILKHHLRETVILQGSTLPVLVTGHLEQTTAASVAGKVKKASSSFNSPNFAVLWVGMVLDYYQRLLSLVQSAFEGDPSVSQTIYDAIREIVNIPNPGACKRSLAPTTNAPELLSIYMDLQIKHLSKSLGANKLAAGYNVSLDETEDFLKKSLSFLGLIKDKDAFEAHYAAHFAKRFLNAKTSFNSTLAIAGNDLEELLISKLGEELSRNGSSFEKIVKMRKDVKLSQTVTNEWKSHVSANNIDLVDFELKICNLSDWPKSMTKDHKSYHNLDGQINFIWPSVLRKTMRSFEEYWQTEKKNYNKTLYWSAKFGLMDMRITYPSKTYDINMSTFAGIIILLFAPLSTDASGEPVLAFAEKRILKYEEILELTKIPELELKRQLQSIAVAPRLRLLVKSPMTKDVNIGDEFRLNEKFKSPSTKVKVLTVSAASSKSGAARADGQEEALEVEGYYIEEGRKQLLNAVIVRIMKSRRQLTHHELIEGIMSQLQNRFEPQMLVIKRRIEDLIDKEYLKRDSDSPHVYHYIA